MPGFSALSPNINVNTDSSQLRTELLNTFNRLDGQLSRAPFRLITQNGPAGNVGAAETPLLSGTINFGTLAKSGSSLLVFACGKFAANANAKTLKLVFGSTTVVTYSGSPNDLSWTLQAEIVYNGGSAEIAWGQILVDGTSPKVTTSTMTESLSISQILKVTGTGVATDDVSAYYWKVSLLA